MAPAFTDTVLVEVEPFVHRAVCVASTWRSRRRPSALTEAVPAGVEPVMQTAACDVAAWKATTADRCVESPGFNEKCLIVQKCRSRTKNAPKKTFIYSCSALLRR